MKYAFIQQHRRLWPVSVQCRVLQVSAAGYHAHLVRRASAAQRQRLSDEALLVHIKAVHAETRGAYGWRSLVARSIPVGKQRVQKLMQLHDIRAKGKRRFKVTTDSNHKLPISPNFATTASSTWPSPTRSGSATSPTSPLMRAGFTWLWSLTCSAARWWSDRCGMT